MTKKRGWVVAGAVFVALVAVFYVIGGMNQTGETAGPTPTTSSPAAPTTVATTPQTPASSLTGPPTSSQASARNGSLDWSEDLLEAGGTPALDAATSLVETFVPVCRGTGGEGAPYAGSVHPMALVGPSEDSSGNQWGHTVAQADQFRAETGHSVPAALRPRSTSQVQLVTCVTERLVPAPSCGTYTRGSDGASGELRRTKGTVTVRVRIATTGALIGQRTFDRSPPSCPTTASGPVASGEPPWMLDGQTPGLAEAYSFVTALLTGSPR
ncbi:hypothetical protein [Terrabacter carboxydivorans]|uniref:PknH-like extracellular domain-containing protein n=1 Tax=Terrabacter carboxydivorans TaxID=619730 RepID=A0ABP5ZG45_9MICO